MEKLIIARVLHVLGVVLWIGGVAMVTTVLLPAVKKFKDSDNHLDFFEQIEHRFALLARYFTMLTGLSGFYMLYAMDAWDRYKSLSFWWLHLMTIVWLIFTVMLFILEPTILKRKLREAARNAPDQTFSFITRMHWVLLTLSLIAIVGAVAGSHGWSF